MGRKGDKGKKYGNEIHKSKAEDFCIHSQSPP